MNKTTVVLIGCVVILCVGILLHPIFIRTESFQSSQRVVETVYTYTGGNPWSQGDVSQWRRGLVNVYSTFDSIQKEIQDIYEIYVSVESQLEQGARKKHSHWVTMTPSQREHADMVNNPLSSYYDPMKSQSRLPLGGLKDNEGGLPFGIPQVSLTNPTSEIQFDWLSKSNDEISFYKQSKSYANLLVNAITRVKQHADLLEWSTSQNKIASLLPRIETLQENANKKSKHLQDKKQNEGFEVTKRTITIPVYSFTEATNTIESSKKTLSGIRSTLARTREDILKAKQIVNQLNQQGMKAHDKLKSAARSSN